MNNTTIARFCVEVDLLLELPKKIMVYVSKTKTILQKGVAEQRNGIDGGASVSIGDSSQSSKIVHLD